MISNILGGRKMIPVVEKMEVFPVAGHDCMELNLSGAHAPYFTRNIVILTDSNGVEGVGEVPGGDPTLYGKTSGTSGSYRLGAGQWLQRKYIHSETNRL